MRTLPTGYELPMRDPQTPLREGVDQFFKRTRLQWKTIRGYRYTFEQFDRWRAGATLADLNPRTVDEFLDQFYPTNKKQGPYNVRNKLVALKSLARYLAERKDWYAKPGCISVLAAVKLPAVPKLGRKPYEDSDLRAIVRIASQGRFGLRDRAVVVVQLATTLRADETRTLQLCDYHRRPARTLGTSSSASQRPTRVSARSRWTRQLNVRCGTTSPRADRRGRATVRNCCFSPMMARLSLTGDGPAWGADSAKRCAPQGSPASCSTVLGDLAQSFCRDAASRSM